MVVPLLCIGHSLGLTLLWVGILIGFNFKASFLSPSFWDWALCLKGVLKIWTPGVFKGNSFLFVLNPLGFCSLFSPHIYYFWGGESWVKLPLFWGRFFSPYF